MTETETHLLTLALLCLVVVNWTVALTLLRLSAQRPTIRALTERAWLAALIALVTTLTLVAQMLPDGSPADVASRVLMVAISLYPLWWLWSYYAGRF